MLPIRPAVLVSLAFLAAAAFASTPVSDATVGFRVTGTGGLTIDSTAPGLTVDYTPDTVSFVVPLATTTTGIGLRDKHMHKYLEVETFPDATLTLKRSDAVCTSATVKGDFTIHGVTKPVVVGYRASQHGKDCRIKSELDVDMHDFGIDVPAYLGIHVDRQVSINVQVDLPPEASNERVPAN